MGRLSETQIPGYEGYVTNWSSDTLPDPGTLLVQSVQKVIAGACEDLDKVVYYEDGLTLAREISEAIHEYMKHIKSLPAYGDKK